MAEEENGTSGRRKRENTITFLSVILHTTRMELTVEGAAVTSMGRAGRAKQASLPSIMMREGWEQE